MLRKFLEEQAHKPDLLDQHRPKHWESLAAYLKRFEVSPVAAEPETAAMPETQPEHLTEAEEVLMFRLNWCQSLDEYSDIRAQLETLYNDFDGRYWALLPEGSKQRICSLAA